MLNPFPILFLAPLGYLILRLTVGGLLFYYGYTHLVYRRSLSTALSGQHLPLGTAPAWIFGTLELIAGIMFIFGFYTQIAAIAGMAFSPCVLMFRHPLPAQLFAERIFYVLLFAASLCLFITGAGALAFDLPI